MVLIRIEPGADPQLLNIPTRTVERQLNNMIHEEELPVEGTMSLSTLKTDGLPPNDVMTQLTGDDGYYGVVYICGMWYKSLSREQINAVLDWMEDGTLPDLDAVLTEEALGEEESDDESGYSEADDCWSDNDNDGYSGLALALEAEYRWREKA